MRLGIEPVTACSGVLYATQKAPWICFCKCTKGYETINIWDFVIEGLLILCTFQVTNSAVKECDVFYDPTGKDFLDPAIDETVKVGTKQGEKMEQ